MYIPELSGKYHVNLLMVTQWEKWMATDWTTGFSSLQGETGPGAHPVSYTIILGVLHTRWKDVVTWIWS